MKNLFEGISPKNREKLFKTFEAISVKFTKNMNIISYMNRKNTIGVVEYGTVQIVLSDYDGNTTLIDELHENEIFGAMISSVILDPECEIIAKEDTKITFIDYEEITNNEIIKSEYYITFIQNLLVIIFEQITVKNDRIQVITKKTIREKLLTYFNLMLKKQDNRKYIELPFTLSDLANYLSVDRSAMMREMKNLKEDGLIESKGRIIYIYY